MDVEKLLRALYPYGDRYGVIRSFPEEGLDEATILAQMKEMSSAEDKRWENGKCSGTMYCGDHEHYEFLNECYAQFSHVNALQRDICPSMNRFESEIIAMALDMLHGEAVQQQNPSQKACGAIGFGGTESILNAVLAYRNKWQEEHPVGRPEMIWPDTAHPFPQGRPPVRTRAIVAPTDPKTIGWTWISCASTHHTNTAVVISSAGNYLWHHRSNPTALGCRDREGHLPARRWLPWRLDPAVGPGSWLREHPGVRFQASGSHLDLRRHSQVRLWFEGNVGACLAGQVAEAASVLHAHGLEGRRVCLARHCRQPFGRLDRGDLGLIGAPGQEGFSRTRRKVFERPSPCRMRCALHADLRLMGQPTFCFSFTSDAFQHLSRELTSWRPAAG